jgi:hypothetical protein
MLSAGTKRTTMLDGGKLPIAEPGAATGSFPPQLMTTA